MPRNTLSSSVMSACWHGRLEPQMLPLFEHIVCQLGKRRNGSPGLLFPQAVVQSLPSNLYSPSQPPCLSDWKWVGCDHGALCGLCGSNSKYGHRCYGPGHKEGDQGSFGTTAGFCWLSTALLNMLNLNVFTRRHCSQVHPSPYHAPFLWFELI